MQVLWNPDVFLSPVGQKIQHFTDLIQCTHVHAVKHVGNMGKNCCLCMYLHRTSGEKERLMGRDEKIRYWEKWYSGLWKVTNFRNERRPWGPKREQELEGYILPKTQIYGTPSFVEIAERGITTISDIPLLWEHSWVSLRGQTSGSCCL